MYLVLGGSLLPIYGERLTLRKNGALERFLDLITGDITRLLSVDVHLVGAFVIGLQLGLGLRLEERLTAFSILVTSKVVE